MVKKGKCYQKVNQLTSAIVNQTSYIWKRLIELYRYSISFNWQCWSLMVIPPLSLRRVSIMQIRAEKFAVI